jgi:seipin
LPTSKYHNFVACRTTRPANASQALIRKPFDIVFSTTAIRAYLTTFLVIFAGLVLFGFAVAAYALFYWSYIPRIGFERTIYLQFDNVYHNEDNRYDSAANPYGTVTLAPDLVSLQKYDISIELAMPRTPANRDAGNFMLDATMYAAGTVLDPVKDSMLPGQAEEDNRLARSRRPAILPYRSIVVECMWRLVELPWYILGWRSEMEKLTVVLWEDLEFLRGWRNVPATMRLDVQSTRNMQIYSAKALFRARFTGLRWLMYNHRIISAIIFITSFWITELVFAGLAWAALSFYLQTPPPEVKSEPQAGDQQRIKQEPQDDEAQLSDTERTFPTTSKQTPLRYQSPVKQEEEDDTFVLPEASNRAVEADDEDEDADTFLDSGIGTSLESSAARRDSMRKRRGRARPEDDVK